MKSLERRFNNITKKKPLWSTYSCFAETIKEQEFSKRIIKMWFNKLVDKDDYDSQDKRQILSFLYELTYIPQLINDSGLKKDRGEYV